MEVPTIIGFIGDGQLARMSAHQALQLGFKCHFFGKNINGPCKDLGDFFLGELNDVVALEEFFHKCDVVTLENEFVDSTILSKLRNKDKLYPSVQTFSKIENKLVEKQSFENAKIPVCEYKLINHIKDLQSFVRDKNYPVMLKAAKGGYDGFGNRVVKNEQQAIEAIKFFKRKDSDMVIAEQMVSFQKEVAITVARNISGQIKTYPVVDTVQENNICHYVVAPAELSNEVCSKINDYAIKAMEELNAVGVFSFEFFILNNGDVILNESAPRPHNSAHYTMDGSETSQFENHIRAICNLDLGDTYLTSERIVMVNLLGTDNRETKLEQIDDYLKQPNVILHMYGKDQSRVGRKMGHLNLLSSNGIDIFQIAKEISQKVRI